MATAYCDVCIHICHGSNVHDFHIISIPIHDRHTGEINFNTFTNAMYALYLNWSEKIIVGYLGGNKKMMGRYQGVITRIQRVANPGFMRVCCGAHHIDLSMQLFYLAIPDTFYSMFTSIVSYLHLQQNFIQDKRSNLPLICETICLNMIKGTTCFGKHWIAVIKYLRVKNPDCMTYNSWWILLIIVHEIMDISVILCR